MIRSLLQAVAVGLILAATVCQAGEIVEVGIVGYKFVPAELKVSRGTTVTWVNKEERTSHSVLFLEPGATARSSPPSAAMLADACGGCHGTRGVSAGPSIPSLAGQSKEYFVVAMKRYKSGERPSTIMGRLAKGYSDAEIEAMAAYFAKQKPVPQSARTDPALVRKGMAIYYKQCKYCHLDGALWRQVHQYREFDKDCNKSCHLDYGPDKGDDTPMIAGQWLEYLEIQMNDFKNGTRNMSARKAKMLKPLSQEDMNAVANFYASQTDLAR